ncbi:TPA: HlyD family efflux transporter periplasmic adaptor subunit [Vibrio alginolyticus]|uniref:HlyD family efflux transporter periplasmic adaptor subunit n=1 Tax=Vibrio alginolyticus TaxID=663 RepID=UPI001BD5F36D|nr:HlyD family efflux transporter periplasmic adaptor subunit [Vibrio alginolyticus]ELA8363345.1 HlyD family efflux transporter periplasmic adaptor subunit [Vibrio alginolyticus]MBT0035586.1 HlyD family efflux transporter periplasmic adaptor subunit [Vibrio alginolyticus]HCZ9047527.1 HlyD family efflux transporter periplasmic adaptor subunit [Vibrio alginolyticus]HCZ9302659.1 HlyD family efflux transporter periplasmic adaptor subunit [Vibrio alginolyticus]
MGSSSKLIGGERILSARAALWLCSLIVAVFILWAAFSEIDEVTRGEGKIIPSSRLQKIQSLEGGIVQNLLVKEGQLVNEGDILIHMDKTRFQAAYREGRSQVSSLLASITRLEAEVKNKPSLTFSDQARIDNKDLAFERALFETRRNSKKEKISGLKRRIMIVEDQLAILRPMVKSASVSKMEALRLEKELEDLKGQIVEVNNSYMQDAYTELTQKKAELNVLNEALVQRQDQLLRTEIVSPVKGMVNDIVITTKGGVVQPGEPIMYVLPIDEQLLVEAKIAPEDIAFLAPGMPAKVKITAYDFSIYGDLEGEVIQISPDTIEEETSQGKVYFYQILVKTETNFLEKEGKQYPIRPGMIAQVDVLGGKKTVLNYLLNPLLKAKLN